MADPQRFAQCVEAALAEALGGFVLLDRDLELPGDQRAMFVGADESGRLTLVLGVEGEGEGPLLAALDALSFARAQCAPLARHLDDETLRFDLPARVVLLAESWSRKLSERLQPLGPDSVIAFAVKRIKSAKGETLWLAPAHGPAPAAEAELEFSVAAFLDQIPAEQQPLARLVARKLERLDPELEVGCARRRLFWRFRGELLCRLELAQGQLHAFAAPDFRPRALRRESEVDALLDGVVRAYVGLVEGVPARSKVTAGSSEVSSVALPSGTHAASGAEAARPLDPRRVDPRSEEPRRIEPRPALLRPQSPLLTPEELAAFRD